MATEIHIDYETYSEQNLKTVGAYRYAADPSTEVLMAAYSIDDGPVHIVVPDKYISSSGMTLEENRKNRCRLSKAIQENAALYAHNAPFEISVSEHHWSKIFPDVEMPSLDRWMCTAAMSRRAGLPSGLEAVADKLELGINKDKAGPSLIAKFSKPRKPTIANPLVRTKPSDDPAAFQQFMKYCKKDVEVERMVREVLGAFEPTGHCREVFEADKSMNHRGFPVNVSALEHALQILEDANDILIHRFFDVVDYLPSQRDKVLNWLQERGYPSNDLQETTVTAHLENTAWADDPVTIEMLQIRADTSFAASKKVVSLLRCHINGLIKGTIQYYGAQRTGRWAAKLVQIQNLKRPTITDTDLAYEMICSGASAAEIYLVHGNPIAVVASCIRHFIQPRKGGFLQADYSGVEARIVCWLADQHDALDDFSKGICRYVKLASKIFHIKEHLIDSDSVERFIGKQAVLGCGFQMSWRTFQETCRKYGKEVPDEICELAVETFREVNYKVATLWSLCDTAARNAIGCHGRWFKAGTKLSFAVSTVKGSNLTALFMKLPSGRRLVYPWPRIEMIQSKFNKKKRATITFYGEQDGRYTRVSTYGGKLVENATQATSADFTGHGLHVAEKEGFEPVVIIHDEVLAYETPGKTVEGFVKALCDLPDWATGMPLTAKGKRIPYYLK